MDRIREKSKFPKVRREALYSVAAIAFIVLAVMILRMDFTSHRVKSERISIGTVERGVFEIKVAANGELKSDDIEQLASQVSGRVAVVHVRPGVQVEAGDLLVELVNPQLIASAEEAQSALQGAIGGLKSERAELRTALLDQESLVVRAKFNLESAELQLDVETKLADVQIISELDYKRTQLSVQQAKQLYEIEKNRLREIRDNVDVQVEVAESEVEQMARVLDRAENEVDNLKIVAGISGVVQNIDVEVGEQLISGSLVGRVARHDALYAELRVPAREAGNIIAGQKAVIDIRTGTIEGTVSRIAPGVTDGAVIVDVNLSGEIPVNARPQLQVEGAIFVARIPDTLYVERPAYVSSESTLTVYKIEGDDRRYATRETVKIGKLSLQHAQVLGGLERGDRIITSETGAWQNYERILIN